MGFESYIITFDDQKIHFDPNLLLSDRYRNVGGSLAKEKSGFYRFNTTFILNEEKFPEEIREQLVKTSVKPHILPAYEYYYLIAKDFYIVLDEIEKSFNKLLFYFDFKDEGYDIESIVVEHFSGKPLNELGYLFMHINPYSPKELAVPVEDVTEIRCSRYCTIHNMDRLLERGVKIDMNN